MIELIGEAVILADIDVSVLVAVYNSDVKRLLQTLYSVLIQKDIGLEIVIADDGSADNHMSEIVEFFEKFGFTGYSLVLSPDNNGTVRNLINGMRCCSGRYVKAISPGDYLYDPLTLKEWVAFMDGSGAVFGSGRYLEYNPFKEGINEIISSAVPGRKPYLIDAYLNGIDRKKINYNYLLLDDFFMGAAILVKREVFDRYLKLIEGKVRYAEDSVFRMMISDGLYPAFMDRMLMWYSFGDGVSTRKNIKWYNIILHDHYKAGIVIRDRLNKSDWFTFRYKIYLTLCKNTFVKIVSKYILFPSLLYYRLIRIKTDCGHDLSFDTDNLKEILLHED